MAIHKINVGQAADELRAQAVQRVNEFVSRWAAGKHHERQEAPQFECDFLGVFGLNYRDARLEHRIRGADGEITYADLFWPGELLIEMKSSGASDYKKWKADDQAFGYVSGIPAAHELPKVVIVSDFNNVRLYDLRPRMAHGGWDGERPEPVEFPLPDLAKESNFAMLQFLIGREDLFCRGQVEVDRKAAEELGKLYTLLEEKKYHEHDRILFLMRVLFCLFAEDTHIFTDNLFSHYIMESIDHGQSVASRLNLLFETLDTPEGDKAELACPWDCSTADPALAFPYVDGGLFSEVIRTSPITNDEAREYVVENCAVMDWSKVSPSIFGSLFQSIRTREERRLLGEHYTSEENIEKVLGPLFLDELHAEYLGIANDLRGGKRERLLKFQERLGQLQLLDPACGCGNFLIVAYEKLRKLEYYVIRDLHTVAGGGIQQTFDASMVRRVRLSQLHGIEIDPFPSMIALTAAWLADHLANERLSCLVGHHVPTIPLKDTARILNGNALRADWKTCFADMEGKSFDYIFGNPPYNGARTMSPEQKSDVQHVFKGLRGVGDLDHVAAWYWLAAQYKRDSTETRFAYVSTNSIVQGQQVPILWKPLLEDVEIFFAHRTFKWSNEATGKAAVHCVIIGAEHASASKKHGKKLWDECGALHQVKSINAYLYDKYMVFIEKRNKPICDVPEMRIGNQPIDNNNYIFSSEDRTKFINEEPCSEQYFHLFIGSREFLHNKERYILRVADIEPYKLKRMPKTVERINNVRKFKEDSNRDNTKKLAETPKEFQTTNIPNNNYIVVPEVSSENRSYIPI